MIGAISPHICPGGMVSRSVASASATLSGPFDLRNRQTGKRASGGSMQWYGTHQSVEARQRHCFGNLAKRLSRGTGRSSNGIFFCRTTIW
jgi:hypothetical protein